MRSELPFLQILPPGMQLGRVAGNVCAGHMKAAGSAGWRHRAYLSNTLTLDSLGSQPQSSHTVRDKPSDPALTSEWRSNVHSCTHEL